MMRDGTIPSPTERFLADAKLKASHSSNATNGIMQLTQAIFANAHDAGWTHVGSRDRPSDQTQ